MVESYVPHPVTSEHKRLCSNVMREILSEMKVMISTYFAQLENAIIDCYPIENSDLM